MNKFDHSAIDGRLLQVLLALFEQPSVTRAEAPGLALRLVPSGAPGAALRRASLLCGFDVAPPLFNCPPLPLPLPMPMPMPMPMYRVGHQRHQADPMHPWLRQDLHAVVAPALVASELRPPQAKAA
jgi:hypothetical protein